MPVGKHNDRPALVPVCRPLVLLPGIHISIPRAVRLGIAEHEHLWRIFHGALADFLYNANVTAQTQLATTK